MTLEQPGLGSDPPNRSGRERGAIGRVEGTSEMEKFRIV